MVPEKIKNMKRHFFLFFVACSLVLPTLGQQPSTTSDVTLPARTATSELRAAELIRQLNIQDDRSRSQMQVLLTRHLDLLNDIFEHRRAAINKAEASTAESRELAAARAERAWAAANGEINKRYADFLGKLSLYLRPDQNEKLKDLMTEGGLQREYQRFQLLLPDLKEMHKAQIMAYLREARENAMNAETAKVRQDWFIKFRGRANNYLAGAGYDLRKATEALEARQAASQP